MKKPQYEFAETNASPNHDLCEAIAIYHSDLLLDDSLQISTEFRGLLQIAKQVKLL